MAGYGLIVHADVGRAEQYAHVVEGARLRSTVARTGDEALFHVRRLGVPSVVLVDIAVPGDAELAFLRQLAGVLRPGTAPVVAVVDSRQTYERVARHMIELRIGALLTRSHNLRTIERAVRATAMPGSDSESPEPEPAAAAPAPARPGPPPPPPASGAPDFLEAVRASGSGEHPLVAELASRPVLQYGASDADLQRLAAETAGAFRAKIAAVWVDRGERVSFAAFPRVAPSADLRDGGGDWLDLRNAIAGSPLHVGDAAKHRLLMHNRLVADGTVRSYAAAPLQAHDGRTVGAIAVADPRPRGIAADVLEPLTFWAARVGIELRALQGDGGEPTASAPPAFPDADGPRPRGDKAAKPRVADAARGLLSALDAGVVITAAGAVAYANPRALELLSLGKRDLRGMRRSELLSLLAAHTDGSQHALQDIAGAALDQTQRTVQVSFTRPRRCVLRWRTRRLQVGVHQGLLDEITDLTAQAIENDAREKLVRVDALTQLPNRRGAEEALGRSMSWALRTSTPLSIGLFGVDCLNVFESSIASQLFRSAAWILRDVLRGYDLATRYDTNLLLAILPGVGPTQVSRLAERYRSAVERTSVAGLPRMTVSGGMAAFDGVQDGQQLVATAAAALDAAMRRGGNVIV